MEQLAEFLGGLPLFKTFSQADLGKLVEKSQRKTYSPGEEIIRFGQPGRFLGIVIEGKAEAVVTDRRGNRRLLGLINAGGLLGEISLLTGEPTTADVTALEKCEVLLIPQEIFSTVLATNAEAIKVMARTMTERLRNRQKDEEAQARVEEAWRRAPDPYGLRLSTSVPMKLLVINCGSSSLKFAYYDTAQESNNTEGIVERIGLENSRITVSRGQEKVSQELGLIDHRKAFGAVIRALTDDGVIRDMNELTAVGHRVVHGGDKLSSATIVTDEVIEQIEANSDLAPLHNPLNLMAIREAKALMPGVPQVAVFDTGFHQKMPPQAHIYALPYDYYEKHRIRRYGFHGISHHYVALQAAGYLKRSFQEVKLITCHLGSGASICAIDHGRSVDTSMGMTPLEGLIMGTRCGDLDPSVVIYLVKRKGLSIEQIDEILNNKSGLRGLSGISSDFREIEQAANKGDPRAVLTTHAFCYRARKYVGAYVAALGGLDALVFTGGIGEGSAWVRSLVCQGLSYMGIELDDLLNRTIPKSADVAEVSGEHSRVKVLVINTDEERMIARETIRVVGNQNVDQIIKSQPEKRIPIEVSAHHVHLSPKEVEALFGAGYSLTPRAGLSQPGQFACNETVNLIGPRGTVERVRVLGPVRNQTQVEISMTEEFKLGLKAPIRASGDLKGSPGLTLGGPAGRCDMPQGVICALRHIHASPEDALSFGLKDRDIVKITVRGERTLTFGDVLVRLSPDFRLSMHIDTDEANAAGITTGMSGYLEEVQEHR
ncbi:MAG: acetate/propionate family kinase [Chloroflexi bacterium]|nr:acetate/propionate family kinase [Chloroflexota bacterium]